MVNTSFVRFSSLVVVLVLVFQVVWMSFIWEDEFYQQISRECILQCHIQPEIHADALEYVNKCVAFVYADNSELKSKIEVTLKQLVSNVAKFQVECDSRGVEKSFRFIEAFDNQESTYLVIVVDTSNCNVVRLENFCDFMDKTEVLNKTEFQKMEL
jgi:hypothetical protein